MNKYRPAALALATCAASLAVAACSAGTPKTPTSSPASTSPSASSASSAQSVTTSAPPSTGAPIASRTISLNTKLGSFPIPAKAKVVENMAGGQALVLVFGLIAPGDVARFYATALPQAGYTVST